MGIINTRLDRGLQSIFSNYKTHAIIMFDDILLQLLKIVKYNISIYDTARSVALIYYKTYLEVAHAIG